MYIHKQTHRFSSLWVGHLTLVKVEIALVILVGRDEAEQSQSRFYFLTKESNQKPNKEKILILQYQLLFKVLSLTSLVSEPIVCVWHSTCM